MMEERPFTIGNVESGPLREFWFASIEQIFSETEKPCCLLLFPNKQQWDDLIKKWCAAFSVDTFAEITGRRATALGNIIISDIGHKITSDEEASA